MLQSRVTLAVREEDLGAVRNNLAAQTATLEKLLKLYEAEGIGPDERRIVSLKADIASNKYLLAGAINVKALRQLPFADPLF